MLSRRDRLAIVAIIAIYGLCDMGSTWLVLGTGSGYESNPFAVAMIEQYGMYCGLLVQKSLAIALLTLLFVGHSRLLDHFDDRLEDYRRPLLAARYTVPAYAVFVGLQLTVRNLGNLQV